MQSSCIILNVRNDTVEIKTLIYNAIPNPHNVSKTKTETFIPNIISNFALQVTKEHYEKYNIKSQKSWLVLQFIDTPTQLSAHAQIAREKILNHPGLLSLLSQN